MPQVCRTIDWNSPPYVAHIFAKTHPVARIHKINQIKGFEPWDLSHVKERAKICRKLKSRASETVWASSYGRITVLKPRIWIFCRRGSWSQLRHTGDWMSFCKNVCDIKGGVGWAWDYVTHGCTKLRDMRPVENLAENSNDLHCRETFTTTCDMRGCSSG